MRVNDRIIEVNGVNVEKETHTDVIARIKAVPGETKLLVVDRETDKYYKEKGVTVTSTMAQTEHLTSVDHSGKEPSYLTCLLDLLSAEIFFIYSAIYVPILFFFLDYGVCFVLFCLTQKQLSLWLSFKLFYGFLFSELNWLLCVAMIFYYFLYQDMGVMESKLMYQ